MNHSDNVISIDTSRMRRGMRSLAHQIVTRMSCPTNRDAWLSLPESDPHHVSPKDIKSTIGPLADFWQMSDEDAASRIIHMSILVMHSVHTGQYRDPELLAEAMQAQAAAESVRIRLQGDRNDQPGNPAGA
jgi:hypothetical protein